MGVRTLFLVSFLIIKGTFVLSFISKNQQPDARLFRAVKRQAEKGDPKSQYDLAVLYGVGKGTAKNESEAMKWIRNAAAQGEPKSQDTLGI